MGDPPALPLLAGTAEADLYEVLEIQKNADKDEIRKAYRKAALRSHPDKVSEDERPAAEIKFKAVQEAYEILSDDNSRHLYDTHGMSAFDKSQGSGGMGEGMDMNDLFNMFASGGMGGMGGMPGFEGGFPGMGGMGRPPPRPKKGKNAEQNYTVTLEELYKGKTSRFKLDKKIPCTTCNGKGGKDKAKSHSCSVCGGRGAVKRLLQQGQFLTEQISECTNCLGQGQVFKDKEKCKKCKGAGVIDSKNMVELYIPPGAQHGEKIISAGEADAYPGQEPGDIVWTLEQEPHEVFERVGNNLRAELHITLAEALTGFDRVVLKHLDGRGIQLRITQPKGKILSPGQWLKIAGEGMPIKRSDAKGDLFLNVTIDFPKDGWIKDEASIKHLRDILPKPAQPIKIDNEVDERDFVGVDLEEVEEQAGGDWEDDDGEGDEVPGCAQQ
ncbi:hypothetical protein EJ05DRAFT_509793 [Pseudovirgaria hyperparasitica]|uniref:DnaJ-domain-containing protein n=1 Tax=Pseudovirgaria hyperparasitica TaxID=470096 RepID=A0A6A6W8C4_9PEZI|nr:uncharacterized protein EJ05DRAFT_509793 [Pseudovirgaria hyperparasitica]KAF2758903.1 hypothetical protein EJ05DRAFT_509793 [Pseudovirgaria hyperparasitica]